MRRFFCFCVFFLWIGAPVFSEGIPSTSKSPLLSPLWTIKPDFDISSIYKPYIQKYSLSCEFATIKMILESFSVRRSEDVIIRSIPHYNRVLEGNTWGDPEMEFVGTLTGSQRGKTGYGMYEGPIATYFRKKGYITHIQNTQTATGTKDHEQLVRLFRSLERGSRVIVWGDWCTSEGAEDGILDHGGGWILRYLPLPAKNTCTRSSEERTFSWKTSTDKTITGVAGEHTFLLLGYIGTLDYMSSIIVWDTYTGRHIYSYDEWMRKWKLLENRSLIIEKNYY